MVDPSDEFSALQAVIEALQPLDAEVKGRILNAAALFLQIAPPTTQTHHSAPSASPELQGSQGGEVGRRASTYPPFSAGTDMSPKEYLFEKQPRTDVERIAALAFYLTHYRDTPHFKTLDLSKLNTEAAQPKFANTANSASNAVKQGYLVASTKGMRQISAAGERFVAALPDRDAARDAMASAKPRRKAKKAAATKPAGT